MRCLQLLVTGRRGRTSGQIDPPNCIEPSHLDLQSSGYTYPSARDCTKFRPPYVLLVPMKIALRKKGACMKLEVEREVGRYLEDSEAPFGCA